MKSGQWFSVKKFKKRMNKRIIFHIPVQLDRNHASASQIRPLKMIAAFQNIGYAVDIVEGPAKKRQAQIVEIKKNIRAGVKYDFVYSESSTMPTLLTESHHLPTHPCLDFGFFQFCKKNNIPIGLFYRDIHWCFINKNKDWKQRVARYFYRYDLKKYQKLVDVFFLPSLEMLPHIPFHFDGTVATLPPGGDEKEAIHSKTDNSINILYVGGVGGNYDVAPLLGAVSECPFVNLTLCCRPSDWEKVAAQLAPLLSENIRILHKQPEELPELYAAADLFSLFFHTDYWEFAVPFKLFEAVSYQVPLLAAEGTWCGKFVHENRIGFEIPHRTDELIRVLNQIHDNPAVLQDFRNNLSRLAPQHTWESRARKVADELTQTANV